MTGSRTGTGNIQQARNITMSESKCEVTQSCPTLATPWTVAYKAPLSMGFFKQEYWSGFSCPPPGHPPNAGFKPVSLTALHWQERLGGYLYR